MKNITETSSEFILEYCLQTSVLIFVSETLHAFFFFFHVNEIIVLAFFPEVAIAIKYFN